MKQTERYIFPAVLTYEEGFEIAVTFPDLPRCATSGENEMEAYAMAKEALGLHLWGMEQDNDEIPAPSAVKDIQIKENERVILVEVFMPSVRLAANNRSVNRTVTLPAWLNAVAIENNINFSQLLQEAIKTQLNV